MKPMKSGVKLGDDISRWASAGVGPFYCVVETDTTWRWLVSFRLRGWFTSVSVQAPAKEEAWTTSEHA